MNQTISILDSTTVQRDKYLLAGLKFIGSNEELDAITKLILGRFKSKFKEEMEKEYSIIDFFIDNSQEKILNRYSELFGKEKNLTVNFQFFELNKKLDFSVNALEEYKEEIMESYSFERVSFDEKDREYLKRFYIIDFLNKEIKYERKSLFYTVPEHFLKGKRGEYKRNSETRKILQQKDNLNNLRENDKFEIIVEILSKAVERRNEAESNYDKKTYTLLFDPIEILERKLKELTTGE